MNEITLRLPSETATALRSEADQRGVSLESHLGEIIDAYLADDERGPRPVVEYGHTVAGHPVDDHDRRSPTSEEIGSFRYGSRSVRSE